MTLPRSSIPPWASFASYLGSELASCSNVQVGEHRPTIFLSVPTGQFLAPLIVAGALSATPKLESHEPKLGESFRAAGFDGESQVRDLEVKVVSERFFDTPDVLFYEGPANYKRKFDRPLIRLPEGVPDDRSVKVLTEKDWQIITREFKRFKEKPAESAEVWWTLHCLSPVVIIGESLEYVDKQRVELLRDVPDWIDERVRPLVAYSKPGVYSADRLLHYPYSYLTIDADKKRPWMRMLKPRLVVYTSWRAYYRRVRSALSSSPTVVLVNRRVQRSEVEAAALVYHDPSVKFEFLKRIPAGFGVRVSLDVSEPDDGRMYGIDEEQDSESY